MFRQRNGAYGWSIARDVADPELWTERYRCPTWFDYLRQRNRATRSETVTEQQAIAFHIGPGPVRVRRMLERPFGSVRSKDHTTDMAPGAETIATRTASPTIGAAPTAQAVRVIAWPKRTWLLMRQICVGSVRNLSATWGARLRTRVIRHRLDEGSFTIASKLGQV
jgi:hypothetical protein